MPPPRSRIADVEALRAFAILLVFLHHLRSDLIWWSASWKETSQLFAGGAVGVDLFLVVSGFVIGRSLLPQLRSAQLAGGHREVVIAFWLRRFWRLIPSAWLWLFVPVLLAALFNDSGVFGTLHANVLAAAAGLFQVANVFFLWALDRVEMRNSVFVYWSLSLEEQFYLALPFLALLTRRALPIVLTVLIVAQLLVDRLEILMFPYRTEGLFTGLLLSMWQRQESYRVFEPLILRKRWVRALFVVGSLAMLAFLDSENPAVSKRYGHVPKLLTATGLVWAATYDNGYIVRARWLRPAVEWIGSRSYALYLVHVPSFLLTREIVHRLDLATPIRLAGPAVIAVFIATGVLLPVVLADLNYRFVEVPLRRWGRAIADGYVARRRVEPNGGGPPSP